VGDGGGFAKHEFIAETDIAPPRFVKNQQKREARARVINYSVPVIDY